MNSALSKKTINTHQPLLPVSCNRLTVIGIINISITNPANGVSTQLATKAINFIHQNSDRLARPSNVNNLLVPLFRASPMVKEGVEV